MGHVAKKSVLCLESEFTKFERCILQLDPCVTQNIPKLNPNLYFLFTWCIGVQKDGKVFPGCHRWYMIYYLLDFTSYIFGFRTVHSSESRTGGCIGLWYIYIHTYIYIYHVCIYLKYTYMYVYIYIYTIWLFNIATENHNLVRWFTVLKNDGSFHGKLLVITRGYL